MYIKRSISCLLVFVLIASLLTGCHEQETSAIPSKTTDYKLMTYTDVLFPFEPGYVIDVTLNINDTIVALGHDGAEYGLSFTKYKLNKNNEPSFSEPYYKPLNNSENYNAFYGAVARDSSFFIMAGDKEGKVKNKLLHFSNQGKVLEEIAVGQFDVSDVSGITLAEENTIVVFGKQIMTIDLCTGEKRIVPIDEGDYIWTAHQCDSGLMLFSSLNGASNINISTGEITSVNEAIFGVSNCQGYQGECICYDLDCVFEYNPDNDRSTELLVWNSNNNNAGITKYVCRLDEDTFVFQGTDSDALIVVGKVLKACNESANLRIAVVSDGQEASNKISHQVMAINSMFDEYKYEIIEYDKNSINRLITELSTNNSPDLVLFRSGVDTSTSYFENLYDYIEADPDLSRNSFLPGLLPAMEAKGELHELWSDVKINTVAIRESDYDPNRAFTTKYCAEVMKRRNYRSVFGEYMSAENLLLWIADISTGAYINKQEGTCQFTTEGFGELLKWCNDMDLRLSAERPETQYNPDEVLLFLESLSTPERLAYWPMVFSEPLVMVGFPNSEGNGSYYECSSMSMAIPTNSSNKDGAWFFIRNQLLIRTQLSIIDSGEGFPVNYEAFKRGTRRYLKQPEYDQLIRLTKNTTKAINHSDEVVRQIILECGLEYLNGEKTLEDTIAVIQSRVGILVGEKYG